MKWTTETPTEPGWYWVRSPRSPMGIVLVVPFGSGLAVDSPMFVPEYVCDCDDGTEWAGPIPAPKEE